MGSSRLSGTGHLPREATLLVDSRVRSVLWRDLVPLQLGERLRELMLPLPWLLLALLAAARGLQPLALICFFYFFLTGLRLVHDVFHGNVGLPRRVNDGVLGLLSVLMLGSMHAVRLTHLQHHRDCLGAGDTEGATARRRRRLASRSDFPLPVARRGLAAGDRQTTSLDCWRARAERDLDRRGLLLGEFGSPLPRSRYGGGAGADRVFAVWTVHHDCDRWEEIARTLRHRLKSAVAFNMFYHLEHHLYPRVPTCHLPALAQRLDRAAPGIVRKPVY